MQINIVGQNAEITENDHLIANSVNLYTANFIFDSAWDDFSKTAVFDNVKQRRECVIQSGQCIIPAEMLKFSNTTLKIGVYGVNGDVVMPTVWAQTDTIQPGAAKSDPASTITPSLGTQILDQVNQILGNAVSTAVIDSNGHLILTLNNGTAIDAGQAQGQTPVRGTDYWTADDIAAIQGYVNNAILGGEW